MNPAALTYTPLECLLLFQSLVSYGTDEQSFARISDLLTNNSFVKSGNTYDPGRLTSNSLRELFLQLLSNDLRAEGDGCEDGIQPGSKKRKVPSPISPTTMEAMEHKDKLPVLADRLYARYKYSMVEAISEDERRYAILQQEVEEIERGEWDDRILKEDKAMANRNGSVSSKESRAKIKGTSPASPTDRVEVSKGQPSTEQSTELQSSILPIQRDTRHQRHGFDNVLGSKESTPPSSLHVVDLNPDSNNPTALPISERSMSNGPHDPSPVQSVPHQPPPPLQQLLQLSSHQQQQQPALALKWEPPYGPPHQPQLYPHGTPYPPQFNSQQYPAQSYSQPLRGSLSSPHGLQHPHVPSSPLNLQHPHAGILPTPNGGHRSPGSPHGLPLDAPADVTGQQHCSSSGSPMMQPPPIHASPIQPQGGGLVSSYPPQQRRVSGDAPSQWNPPFAPQYQSSPHQVPTQQHPFQPPNQRSYPSQPNLFPPENRQYNSPYNVNQNPRPPSTQSLHKPRPSLPGTPTSQGKPHFLTGSGTRWTPNPTGSTPRMFSLADRPALEPISPIQRPAQLLSAKRFANSQASRAESKPKSAARKRGAQRTRAGSMASSVVAGSYRSQSVASHADELSLDNNVKEEVATPLPLPPGLDDETGDTTADDALPNLRNRRSNIATSPRRLKRKRHENVGETPRPPREQIVPPSHVLWTRAFPKISASALESVTGHRHASIFALPVKERDAPGYKSLILRPQDLKSIKSAILAGNRTATAAVLDDTHQAQSSVWLPISEDLIPPKGIINYAQLEKELMRMFANAIMFNADPDRGLGASWEEMRGRGMQGGDGYEIDEDLVVKDTKAMYADVEQVIDSLRSAEKKREDVMDVSGVRLVDMVRGSSAIIGGSSVLGEGDQEPDELAGDGEATGTMTKRRRRA